MALLTSEQYTRRRESAGARNQKNKEAGMEYGLSEEQADLIIEICQRRHDLHSCDRSMYNTGSGDYHELGGWICAIDERLYDAGLPLLRIDRLFEQMPSDNDRYEGLIDDSNAAEEGNIGDYYDKMEDLNRKIEAWMGDIDKQYHTHFEPSGAQRI